MSESSTPTERTATPGTGTPGTATPGTGTPGTATPPRKTRGDRRVLVGHVISDKMDKTITVEAARKVKHPLYEKFVRRRTRVHAHDENNEARVGDKVEVVEIRPLSKLKRFRLVRILTRAVQD